MATTSLRSGGKLVRAGRLGILAGSQAKAAVVQSEVFDALPNLPINAQLAYLVHRIFSRRTAI